MFVRNNTLCTLCGKSRVYDVYLSSMRGPDPNDLYFAAECYDCMSIFILASHLWEARALVQDISYNVPTSDYRSRARRWIRFPANTNWHWKRNTIEICEEFFPTGVVDMKLVELPILVRFSARIVTSGHPYRPRVFLKSAVPLESL